MYFEEGEECTIKLLKNTSRKLAWHYVIILLCFTQEKLNCLSKTVNSI